ncbi:MAG: hypothetical protein U1F98_10640 [Verrucomicrobiota bacterium]
MNTASRIISTVPGLILALLLAPAAAPAAPGDKPANTPEALFNTNSIPRSLFVVPTNTASGRDPFFPNHTYGAAPVAPKHPGATIVLVLNGLSGPSDHRLAMINGHTFAENEEAEVTSGEGKVRIRCVEIKKDSAVIEVAGERRELRLRD